MPLSGRRRLVLLGLLAGMGASSSLSAQNAKPPPPPAQKFAIPGSAESVSTGGKSPPAETKKTKRRAHGRAESKPRPGAAVATFPGFRILPDGRSRIYVELSKSVTVDEHKSDQALTFTLHDAQVLVKNNKNALITTHFSTPVSRARLMPAGADLNLVLDLRKATSPTHQVVPGENGAARLEIDFPAGDYPLEPGRFEPPAGGGYRGSTGSRGNAEPEAPSTIDDRPPEGTPKPAPPGPSGVGPPAP